MSLLDETVLIPHAFADRKGANDPVLGVSGLRQLKRIRKYASTSSLASSVFTSLGRTIRGFQIGASPQEREEKEQLENRKQILYLRMRNATTYREWLACADELDQIEGNNEWKLQDECEHYDANFILTRLESLENACLECDIGRILHLIRTEFSRHLGDMSNAMLYKHSHVGTKALIDRYIRTALDSLDKIVHLTGEYECDREESNYILEELVSARQAFGRSALLLSGGATFGMNHIGVLKALWEQGILPRVISGASAGSIVCAVLCIHQDDEIPRVLADFGDGDFAVFDEDGKDTSLYHRAFRLLKYGSLFDISHLTRVMKELLGNLTFQEAYYRTRRVLNICVSSADLYELPRLLNYITAPNVLIWSAVAASCSVPVLFSSASLLAKDIKTGEIGPWNPSPQQWIDGSVDNDLPITRLAEMFNVNNFIVSQVNPHVVPFLLKEDNSITSDAREEQATTRVGWFQACTELARDEALFRMQELAELGIFPTTLTKLASVMSQKYSGDVNIFPEIAYSDFPRILTNPTSKFMTDASLCGERATWPKISRVRNHLAIELALDDAVQKMRAKVAFSPSQVDLRLSALSRSGRGRGVGLRKHRKATRSNESLIARGLNEIVLPKSASFHQKSLSTGSAIALGTSMPTIPGSPNPQPRPEAVNKAKGDSLALNAGDILSSGADTSLTDGFDTDDEADDDTDSESPRSPPSGSDLFQLHANPMPSRSQPTTPVKRVRSFLTMASGDRTSGSNTAVPSPTASNHSSPGHSTRFGGPSSPELRYKRLFHEGALPPAILPTQGMVTSRGPAAALSLDLSGAKGMVSRKRSSPSLTRMSEVARRLRE